MAPETSPTQPRQMDSAIIPVANSKGAVMHIDAIPLLKVHDYFQGISDNVLQEVANLATIAEYPTGAVVHEANDLFNNIAFVLRGRLKAVRIDSRGVESLFRMINRGEQFGMLI